MTKSVKPMVKSKKVAKPSLKKAVKVESKKETTKKAVKPLVKPKKIVKASVKEAAKVEPKKEATKKALNLNITVRKPVRKPSTIKKAQKKYVRDPKALSAFIVIRNAPYGFFEEACYKYFSQFGEVKRVRVIRNKKGGFSGKIYVGFKYAEVASIVVTVINKSLMMGEHVIRCRQLLNAQVPIAVQLGSRFGKPGMKKTDYLKKRIAKAHLKKFKENPQRVADFINKQLAKAKENGIDYKFDYSEKLSEALEEQIVRDAQVQEKISTWLKNFK